MIFTKVLLSLAAVASTVVADGAAIAAALEKVNNITTTLQTTVSSWDGDLLGALPITIQSAELLSAINEGTKTAKASAALETLEAVTVAEDTIALGSSVNSTITAIIAAKPKFDKLLLSPVILLNLELEKSATDELSAAIIEKVPAALQATAQQLVSVIDDSFDEGLDAYNPFAGL